MREIIGYLVWILGIPAFIRALTRHKVGILLYHDPEPAAFESHLEYLKKFYNVIHFDRIVDAMTSDDWSEIPPRAIVLNFDDGYRGNAELNAICERHGVTPTLYLCSHVVATRRRFWSKLDGGRSKRLRLVENTALLAKLEDEADYTPEREYPGREALSQDELIEMAHQFDYQSHGRFHFSVLTLGDDELVEELRESRSRIEELSNQGCEHFSYPYGDFSQREVDAVRDAGYRSARTTLPGWVTPDSDRYRLPIVADVPGAISTNLFRLQLTGLPRFFKRLIYVSLTKHVYALRQRHLMSRRVF
jgi:peptidoglycan/xylan/chitin deacetylase (PgdA/CDA1 family)